MPLARPAATATVVDNWDWEPPDLLAGSKFRWEMMSSLQLAVRELQVMESREAYLRGLSILTHHATNYGHKGPQTLALL